MIKHPSFDANILPSTGFEPLLGNHQDPNPLAACWFGYPEKINALESFRHWTWNLEVDQCFISLFMMFSCLSRLNHHFSLPHTHTHWTKPLSLCHWAHWLTFSPFHSMLRRCFPSTTAYSCWGYTSFSDKTIWGFPQIGVPLNHSFKLDFPWSTNQFRVPPIYGAPHINQ